MGASVLNGLAAGLCETAQPQIIAHIIPMRDRGKYQTHYFSMYFASLMVGPIIATCYGIECWMARLLVAQYGSAAFDLPAQLALLFRNLIPPGTKPTVQLLLAKRLWRRLKKG
jgi:hypothetical protein